MKLLNNLPKLRLPSAFSSITIKEERATSHKAFQAIVRKEFTDYMTSWRIIILLIIIMLTCFGSLYTALTTINDAMDASDDAKEIAKESFLFLKLFTVSDGTMPSFIRFVTFLGPLLGIALGFDAINSERNKGTLSRLMAQPIPRDYVLNAKFTAALLINIVLFFSLGLLVTALGILIIGIPPSFEEFARIGCFLVLCIFYIAFWLNLGILFSVQFRQAATSALSGIAIWIFFSIFYSMIIEMISKTVLNPETITSEAQAIDKQGFILNLMRLSPNYLFSESTTTLLSPTVRSLGPLSQEQTIGAVAGPLPLDQSLLLIWPQLTGLIAATMICFAISYLLFMRQEIRSN
ncbi:ABC transporter permease [Aquibacillus koreensis]|uniref:ABC transporter permease n=1 Tax=Aquibacillus koreensis TaxID=279446 RepID=A0A9X4AJ24_9BACI|nr:ABC transporter permease [Aquibacillus koreensis]MCT2534455.1 ABC transporter permease [Aquibacillus koreensis]MDC3421762.1 ABC transporter permease [Aquibacillus koreensis]